MSIEAGSDTEGSTDEYEDAEILRRIAHTYGSDAEEPDEEPAESNSGCMYDSSLPMLHVYLGTNMTKLNSPIELMENTDYTSLPLLPRGSFILFPGQILPLKVYRRDLKHVLQKCIQSQRLVGIVYENDQKTAKTGIFAEIFECDTDPPVRELSLKARGSKRFKIQRIRMEDNWETADVRILPEAARDPPLFAQRLTSLDYLRVPSGTKEDLKKQEKIDRLDAVMNVWPVWVYRQYNALRLSLELRELLKCVQSKGCPQLVIPTDPVELSFWFAQNFIVKDEDKLDIFNSNCVVDRLRKEIDYLTLNHYFFCINCGIFIAVLVDLYPISKEGPQCTFVNSNSDIYQVITLLGARGLRISSMPATTDYTWFPGYGWIGAGCETCGTQIGWKFVAVDKDYSPNTFWALERKSLTVTKMSKTDGYRIFV